MLRLHTTARILASGSSAALEPFQRYALPLSAWPAHIFAIPPTSAASERIFSLVQSMLGTHSDAALADLIEAARMLRYTLGGYGPSGPTPRVKQQGV